VTSRLVVVLDNFAFPAQLQRFGALPDFYRLRNLKAVVRSFC
jgi:hypothetical protein